MSSIDPMATKEFAKQINALGYDGWIGCEYKPKTTTIDGLSWMATLTK